MLWLVWVIASRSHNSGPLLWLTLCVYIYIFFWRHLLQGKWWPLLCRPRQEAVSCSNVSPGQCCLLLLFLFFKLNGALWVEVWSRRSWRLGRSHASVLPALLIKSLSTSCVNEACCLACSLWPCSKSKLIYKPQSRFYAKVSGLELEINPPWN